MLAWCQASFQVLVRMTKTPSFYILNLVRCCKLAYSTYMQSSSCKMLGWMKHKPESRLPGGISVTSDMQNPLQYSCLENPMDGTEEPGRLQSMGSLRVRHDWATSLSLFIFMHWRRKWQPTPVFLPGESQGRRSLLDCRLWSRTALDTTEVT